MSSYYNEFDPYAAQWLRNLIARDLIPAGDVDERSIVDVHADDLDGYTQCHFFAGIGGWALAARMAGWPDDRQLWTGSAPCQPFSAIGKRKGEDDERHLWPEFARLIRAHWPAVVMGEQVASKDGLAWVDGVRADLESAGYAARHVVLPACGVDAPHQRYRTYWVADGYGTVGDSQRARLEGHAGHGDNARARSFSDRPASSTGVRSFWARSEAVEGHDGKTRRIEPGVCPVGHGFSSRMGRLRAYGNAIVPQLAAEVIGAYMDCAP